MSQSMDHDGGSPSRSSLDLADSSARKRVGKACDRCRLKKSKCDGTSPCLRCRQDNTICQFGERKKSVDKVYPKGYVELLEQHFEQLVGGLRECYRLLQEGQPFPGEPLPLQKDGHPLTHDLLQRLCVLRPSKDCSVSFDGFEENPSLILEKMHKQLDADSEETTPEEEEPNKNNAYWSAATTTTTTAFQNPWQKPTNMQLRLESVQQHQKFSPAMFLNQLQAQHAALAYQTAVPQRSMADMSMQVDTVTAPAQQQQQHQSTFDPLDMTAMSEQIDPQSNLNVYQWPPAAIRTPGDFNWNNWLQENAAYMQP